MITIEEKIKKIKVASLLTLILLPFLLSSSLYAKGTGKSSQDNYRGKSSKITNPPKVTKVEFSKEELIRDAARLAYLKQQRTAHLKRSAQLACAIQELEQMILRKYKSEDIDPKA